MTRSRARRARVVCRTNCVCSAAITHACRAEREEVTVARVAVLPRLRARQGFTRAQFMDGDNLASPNVKPSGAPPTTPARRGSDSRVARLAIAFRVAAACGSIPFRCATRRRRAVAERRRARSRRAQRRRRSDRRAAGRQAQPPISSSAWKTGGSPCSSPCARRSGDLVGMGMILADMKSMPDGVIGAHRDAAGAHDPAEDRSPAAKMNPKAAQTGQTIAMPGDALPPPLTPAVPNPDECAPAGAKNPALAAQAGGEILTLELETEAPAPTPAPAATGKGAAPPVVRAAAAKLPRRHQPRRPRPQARATHLPRRPLSPPRGGGRDDRRDRARTAAA